MAKYWEDWSGQTLGAAPTGWSLPWGSDHSTYEVQEDTAGPGGRRLRIAGNDLKRTAYTLDAVDSDSERQDVKVRVLIRASTNKPQSFTIHIGAAGRVFGSSGNETAYIATLASDSFDEEFAAQKYNGGSSSQPFVSANGTGWVEGNLYWVKLDIIGDQITVAIAPEGDQDNDNVTDTFTDTDITGDGGVGFFTFQDDQMDVLAVAIATGTDSEFYSDPASDTSEPTLTNESASADGSDGYSGSVDTDENDGVLYHVVTQSSTSPSKQQVKDGNDDTGSAADASDSQSVSSSGTKNVGQTGVLSASTTYYIHYMHEDSSGNQSTVATTTSFTTASADTTAPTLQSATVDGTSLVLSYNETLDSGSVPATGDFTVTGSSSGAVSVSSVGVSGTDVTLTLSSAVQTGETVALDYTPGTNPIQDDSGNDAASLTGQSVTNNTTDTMTMTGDFDAGNTNPASSSVTNAGAAEPDVYITPRQQTTEGTTAWKQFAVKLTGALNKRPSFIVDISSRMNGGTGGDNRPWYSYDLETWFRPSVTTNVNASNELTWQWGSAFTQDTVYIGYQPIYQLAQSKKLIDWAFANYPDVVHRIPSVGDDSDYAAGTVSGQTDDLSRSLSSQPIRGFGIWNSTEYPDDGLPKRTVVITGGIHAGEHVGDWIMDACVRWLVSSTSTEAQAIRKNFQILVYPNVNPVGRYGGHFRGQWDANYPQTGTNRDWNNLNLESSQVLDGIFNTDLAGRAFVAYYEFHSWTSTTGVYFSMGVSSAPTNAKSLFDTVMTGIGISDHREETADGHLRRYLMEQHGTSHTYALEVVERETYDQADLTQKGEWWAQGLEGIFSQDTEGYVNFTGNYVAETLNGSATVGRQLDAAVYPWPPKLGDTPIKVERGLGADASRAFRMDMGGTTGEVFVVLSSVDYESSNADAAAGANNVTIQST